MTDVHAAGAGRIAHTVAAMDEAGVELGLLRAWSAPHQPPRITDDEVAGGVAEHPTRCPRLAAVALDRPMRAVLELRRALHHRAAPT